jgi:hypothetical protein
MQTNKPKTPRFATSSLAENDKHSLPKRKTKRPDDAQRNQTDEQHSKQSLTLELSGGGAVRLERVVRTHSSPTSKQLVVRRLERSTAHTAD